MPHMNLQIVALFLNLAKKNWVEEVTSPIHILPIEKNILSKFPIELLIMMLFVFDTNEVLVIVENGQVETNVSYYHGW